MIPLLWASGFLLGFLGVQWYSVMSFFPRMGVGVLRNAPGFRMALAAAGVLLFALALSWTPSTATRAAALLSLAFPLGVLLLVPRRVFPVLYRTVHLPADMGPLPDETLVLSIQLSGETVAWPVIDMLVPRHAVNDGIGQTPLLVTYCPACRSGMIFSPVVDGRRLRFSVAGLWRKNMVLVDDETGTLWQQATGEAIRGPLSGKRLAFLGADFGTWGELRQRLPTARHATVPSDAPQGIIPEALAKRLLWEVVKHAALPGLHPADRRLAPHTEVYGIRLGLSAKAWPVAMLPPGKPFVDDIHGTAVHFSWEGAWLRAKLADGTPLPLERHWWLAWSEFAPGSELGGNRPG